MSSMKIGPRIPQFPQGQAVQGATPTTAPQAAQPQANANANQQQQAFGMMVGSGMNIQMGTIPGAQGAMATLGTTSNPAAVMQQLMNQAQVGQQMQAMGQFALQAMNAMGLGNLPQAQQFAMMSGLGSQMVQTASAMAPQAFAQSVLGSVSAPVHQALGQHVMSHGFNQARVEQMGSHMLSSLAQQPAVNWGRQTLGMLGPQYFNNFDARTLQAMPDRSLMPFSNNLMQSFQGASPFQLGQQLLGGVGQELKQKLGQGLLNLLPPSAQASLGGVLQEALNGNLAGAGEAFLKNVGLPKLQDLGQKLFSKIPGLGQAAGGDLANKLIGALTQGGDIKKNLLGAAGDFLKGQLLGPNGKLAGLGQKLLGKLGNGFLGKAAGTVMDFIGKGKNLGQLGQGLLKKFGGKVLDKLGGVGKIASGALSLLNGEFTPEKALKVAVNFIPVVGPIISGLSAIPGVGKIVDKVLGGVGKLIGKIPGVKHVFKGINKVVGGIKKVGKKILGGVGKVLSKI